MSAKKCNSYSQVKEFVNILIKMEFSKQIVTVSLKTILSC